MHNKIDITKKVKTTYNLGNYYLGQIWYIEIIVTPSKIIRCFDFSRSIKFTMYLDVSVYLDT
jgi:hypothetical protein